MQPPGERGEEVVAAINIIPLVDISLVLLIIFMVTTAFISESGLDIKLPTAKATQPQARRDITIAMTKEGEIYLNGEKTNLDELQDQLSQQLAQTAEKVVILKADKRIAYGEVVKIMDIINRENAFLTLTIQQEEVTRP
jgi:biopolymer transport protein ExbD